MPTLTLAQTIAVWILPVLLAITLHEAAHAFVAYRCGDPTAKGFGRLSLNPIKHIDLIGTIVVPIVIGALSHFQFVFGWAKPVPVNWRNLRHPRRDMALVALAGPVSNLIMALFWFLCAKAGLYWVQDAPMIGQYLFLTGRAGIWINLILAVLNLLPIPPLDGSRVLLSILPASFIKYYVFIERFGFLILIALLLTGILNQFLMVPVLWAIHFIAQGL